MSVAQAPQSREVEETVLGALLSLAPLGERGRRVAEDVFAELNPHHFFARETNGVIYEAIRSVHEEGKPVDPLTVGAALRERGKLERVGGQKHLTLLTATVPSAGNALHHARLVIEFSRRYRLWRLVSEIAGEIAKGKSSEEALDETESRLISLRSQIERGRSTVVPSHELGNQFAQKIASPPDPKSGVPTPFPKLANLQGGRLYVLGGYQADGKTALAVQFLLSGAKAGRKIGFVSIEMSAADVRDRIIASFGVPYGDALRGVVRPEHQRELEAAQLTLGRLNFDVIDDESADIAAIRRYARLGRYDGLIIDHLHRIDWTERRELERNVRGITNLAREAEIPILLLAQLHRRGDEFPRPTLSSIRESGMIEAEAAAVWFVWRKRDENKLPTTEAEFVIAKNRYGPTGKFDLFFDPDRVRFTEVARP
jgi:replicative DNA helicase